MIQNGLKVIQRGDTKILINRLILTLHKFHRILTRNLCCVCILNDLFLTVVFFAICKNRIIRRQPKSQRQIYGKLGKIWCILSKMAFFVSLDCGLLISNAVILDFKFFFLKSQKPTWKIRFKLLGKKRTKNDISYFALT